MSRFADLFYFGDSIKKYCKEYACGAGNWKNKDSPSCSYSYACPLELRITWLSGERPILAILLYR